ncbi:MAG: futalosine hydrolase [Phycisphaerales bacterium]
MGGLLESVTLTRRVLVAVAAPAEARAVLGGLGEPKADSGAAESPWRLVTVSDRFDLVVTGVGKANAAGAMARLADPARHGAVLSVGVAGALRKGGIELPLRATVAAEAAAYADEGSATEQGFVDIAAMGFAPVAGGGMTFAADPALVKLLRPGVDAVGVVATVSTCSGTDALAAEIARRTGAVAEEMEGAAVAQTALRLGIPFAEVRVISNTTGDRSKQRWDLKGALERLSDLCARL